MALDENGNPIPGTVDALGAMPWPPPEWLLPQPELAPVPPPLPPDPVVAPDVSGGRKGGQPTGPERIAAPASASGEEAPATALPPALPDFNPMADTDPRADMTPEEIAAAQAPAPNPPSLGELAPDYVGQPTIDRPFNPFEADAVSGGTAPTDKRAPSMPAEYESPFERTVSTVSGATPDDLSKLSPEQLGVAVANLPPEQQAVIKQQWDAAQANYLAGRQLEESHKYLAAMQAANDRATQRTAAVDAEAKRLADIDPDGWMHSRTAAQKLAGFAFVVASGLAGQNGLAMIQQAARENVDAQKANLAKNQARLAGERVSIHDELDRDAVMQQATYETAIRGLQAEMQKYDPRGSTAMGIAATIAQVRAAQVQAAQQQNALRLKQEAELAKQHLDVAKFAEDQRHNVQQEKLQGYGIASENMRAKNANALEEKRIGLESKKAQATATDKAAEDAQKYEVPGVEIDGKPFIAKGTPEAVEKLRQRGDATHQMVSLIDDALRTRSGWTTDAGNSAERQQLAAIWGQAKLAAKNAFELGQITESDLDLIKGALGTDDPSKMRDPTPGMKKARELLIKGYDASLKAHGYPKDKKFDIPYLQERPAEKSPADAALEKVLNDKPKDQGEARAATEAAQREGHAFITPEAVKQIAKWTNDAKGDDAKLREAALTALHTAATQAQTPGVREAAEQALASVATALPPPAETVVDDLAGKQSAHEDLPPIHEQLYPHPRGTLR